MKPTVSSSDLSDQLTRLGAAASPGLFVGCRAIAIGDELQLTSAELLSLGNSSLKARRASGSARIVARGLLAQMGAHCSELPRSASGAAQWPKGYIGSLAHDQGFAVAATARCDVAAAIGIDVEPAIALPDDAYDLVATASEQKQLGGDLLSARFLFCIKEAVYKATSHLDGKFLEPHDVEVCMATLVATTTTGRKLHVHASRYPRLLALAVLFFAEGNRTNPSLMDCKTPP